jgi:plastocyanin
MPSRLLCAALLLFIRPLGATEIHDAPPPASAAAPASAVLLGRVRLSAPEGAPVVNQRYKLIIENGVARMSPPQAVVYVEGTFPTVAAIAPASAEIVQRDLTFHPQLLPVQIGTRVYFPNRDDTYHNVFSFSPAKRFDLGRYRADEPVVPFQIFDRAGLVTLRCDIHEHMRAAILVLDTPFFALTAPDGSFRLAGLPPGRHTVKVWLDSRTTRERAVELTAGGELHVELP